MQKKLCNVEYCDFIVWNKDVWINQRINLDSELLKPLLAELIHALTNNKLPRIINEGTNKWVESKVLTIKNKHYYSAHVLKFSGYAIPHS